MNTGQTVRFKCWECLVFFDLSLVGATEENVGEQELAEYEPSGCPYCGSPDIKPLRDEPIADAPLLVPT